MKRMLLAGLVLSLAAVALPARPAEAQQRFFSNASLFGPYSGVATGYLWETITTLNGGNPFKLDDSTTSLVTFDGEGNLSGTLTVSLSPTFAFASNERAICTGSFTGTYNVDSDGTGTANFSITYRSGPCLPTTGTSSFVIGRADAETIDSTITSLSIPARFGAINSAVVTEKDTKQL